MKYTFGGEFGYCRKIFTISKNKSFSTSILVAFLILSFPLQSFADIINSTDSGAEDDQNIQIKSPDGKDSSKDMRPTLAPTDRQKNNAQNLKIDPQDKKNANEEYGGCQYR